MPFNGGQLSEVSAEYSDRNMFVSRRGAEVDPLQKPLDNTRLEVIGSARPDRDLVWVFLLRSRIPNDRLLQRALHPVRTSPRCAFKRAVIEAGADQVANLGNHPVLQR